MGTMIFDLPAGLTPDAVDELERASVAGGQDGMPFPSEACVQNGQLSVVRKVDESGALQVPWHVDGHGRFMLSSATLMERPAAYPLVIELARGKVNQLRGQAADWSMGGLLMPAPLGQGISQTAHAFARAIAAQPDPEATGLAQEALEHAHQSAQELVRAYVGQVFSVRPHRQPRLDSGLGCRLQTTPPADPADFSRAF